MTLALQKPGDREERTVTERMDALREVMDSEVGEVRTRCATYLNWYSPEFSTDTYTHDAWVEAVTAEDEGLTRANFPIARACVDLWASLEGSTIPLVRAEPERLTPPMPEFDEVRAAAMHQVYSAMKTVEAMKAQMRTMRLRRWLRKDDFGLKNITATRRKNLYGFSWVRVLPNMREQRPQAYVLRDPTTVYPLWSGHDELDYEAVLVAYQMNAVKAIMKYELDIPIRDGRIDLGQDSGQYRKVNDRWYDSTRTMMWVEELWWIDRKYDRNGEEMSSLVHQAVRVGGRFVGVNTFEDWHQLPFIYYENNDERDSYGWSDIASVIDINDELNKRLSQEGDIIGSYSAPRFQLLNSLGAEMIELPGPFELIPLRDQQRIEQILTRIDVYPTQQHFTILLDLLHRVSGLPPIVWGLIQNAQTSGRALTASWKATEARLAPKLMRDEASLRRWVDIGVDYARKYNWGGARMLFSNRDDSLFDDFRWTFPPMEPRDFQEVITAEIAKRNAGGQSTIGMMRAWGDEQAEDTYEEVLAEALNVLLHPEKANAYVLYQRAVLENMQMAQQLGVPIPGQQNPATVAQMMGQSSAATNAANEAQAPTAPPGVALPPTVAGAPANAGIGGGAEGGMPPEPGSELTSGTLVRNGQVSNQLLETRRW